MGGRLPGSGIPGDEAQHPIPAFISKVFHSLCRSLSQCRPWAEFFGQNELELPLTFSEATVRIRKNFPYFRSNYCAIVSLALAVSLLRHPFTFLILLGHFAACIFTDSETLVLLSGLCVVFLTSVGSILLLSVKIGVAVVCVHGALRMTEDIEVHMEPQQHNSSQPNNNDMSPSGEAPPLLKYMHNGEYQWI